MASPTRDEATMPAPGAPAPTGAAGAPPDAILAALQGARRALRADGSADEDPDHPLSDARCRDLYGWMVLTRAFEERCLNLQRQGRIGFYVTCTGQEAASVGSAAALEATDWIVPAYREPAAALMRGAPLRSILDQLIGNAADLALGRQMPCHYAYPDLRIASASSPIGTQITHAVGLGMAARIRGDRAVALAYFGDGATSSNEFHAGLNFAGVYRAPAIFFCQNNQYAISLPVCRQTASPSIAAKAEAYGFPGVRVDGNDLPAVYRATREAVARARGGDGPTLIEAVTYRVHGHTTSDDPGRYRPDAEVALWRRWDPLDRFRRHLTWRGIWTEGDEQAAWERAREEVARAVQASEATPLPDVATLFDGVYAEMPPHLREQRDALLELWRRRDAGGRL